MKKRSTKFYWMTTLILFTLSTGLRAQLRVVTALCENRIGPLGVSTEGLRFGWEMFSPANGQYQSAYQIVMSTSKDKLAKGQYDVWNSTAIKSGQSVLVPYTGLPLKASTAYYWKVRVWDKNKAPSAWSDGQHFCTGIEQEKDWSKAGWIGYEELPDTMRIAPGVHEPLVSTLGQKGLKRPVTPLLRKEFSVSKKVRSAFVFICGLGQYELTINGKKAGNGFLTPGWTYYDKRCLYNVMDITKLLRAGNNCAGVILGNGFFNINRERYFKLSDAFGNPKLMCKIRVNYTDGSTRDIISDNSWKTAPSPILFTSIYGGEDYDARLEKKGWDLAGFPDTDWKHAEQVRAPIGKLTAELDYPVAIMDSFEVKKISAPRPSVYVYDFGQNASGIVALRIRGHRGQTVKLLPAEILNKDHLAAQGATGSPYYLSYTLRSDSVETWYPRFTYYGFRYVQVEGAIPENQGDPGSPVIEKLTSLHIRNSAPGNGTFSCSNPLFNNIFTLINWAIKSNLQSVVTDCPHREKLGWLEQDYLMGASIHYNFDNYNLYRKLVFDMMDAQTPQGFVPDIAPEFVKFDQGFLDSPEWGSTSVIVPWLLYKWYGDKDILEKAYPMMKKYVAYLESRADHHILSYGLGDWFDYGPRKPGEAQLTPKALTATAIYYYDASLLSKAAGVLQKTDDEQAFQNQANEIRSVFNTKFFNTSTNVYSTGSQTALAMPLSVGLVDDQNRQAVLANLRDSIQAHHYALTAGDIGFHFLIDALDNGGLSDVIYQMNNRDDVPGYGYQLRKGATALTESWPALENVSNNHLMLGHIMEWFYSGLAGIGQESTSTGYDQIRIRPQPIGDIKEATGTFHTPYGWVKTDWKRSETSFLLHVTIPPNTNANIYLPVGPLSKVYKNGELVQGRNFNKIPCAPGQYLFEVR